MPITVKIQGFDELMKKTSSLASGIRKDAQNELVAFANLVRDTAIALAPADEGHLRGSIHVDKGDLEVSIVTTVVYAAFMEFGTRKYAAQYVATLPSDWQTYAATFQGRGGGNFDEFLRAIMAWAKRKGIDDKAAYPIALKILRDGVRPHKFLFPAVDAHLDDLKKAMNNLINDRR